MQDAGEIVAVIPIPSVQTREPRFDTGKALALGAPSTHPSMMRYPGQAMSHGLD